MSWPTLRVTRPWDTSRPPPWILEAELDVPETALELDPLADLRAHETFSLPLACELGFRVELPARRISERLVFPLEIPTLVAPPVSVAIHPRTLIVPDDAAEVAFNVRVTRNTTDRVRGKLHVEAPPGFVVEPSPVVEFDMPTEPEQGFRFALRMTQNMRPGKASLRVHTDSATDRALLHRRNHRIGVVAGLGIPYQD